MPDPDAVETPPGRAGVWSGPTERLDRVLVSLGLVRSRNRGAEVIDEGRVTIDGSTVRKAGHRVRTGASLTVSGDDRYVGRAAGKLIAALDAFGIDPEARVALDLGASTGGFTQVLLERGVRLVQAIDVGHGQMAPHLAVDPRVRLVEGCNARDLEPISLAERTGIAEPPSLVTADLSFISLALVIPAIARCAAPDAEVVLLIKPQYEVGRVRDGVVTDPLMRADAIRSVLLTAARHGFDCRGLETSPVIGGAGNIEYLGVLVRDPRPNPPQWEGRIAELCGSEHRAADPKA